MPKKTAKNSSISIRRRGREILGNQDRLHEGVAHCLEHRNGQPWPEWQSKALKKAEGDADPAFFTTCLLYARSVLKNRWPDLEPILLEYARDYEDCKPAISYALRVVGGRWLELEPILINCEKDLATYIKFFIHGQWHLLEDLVLNGTDYHCVARADAMVAYCRLCRRSRWDQAEPILIQALSHGGTADLAMAYVEEFMDGDLQDWDDSVLRGDYDATVTAEYAAITKDGPWTDLEDAVKMRPFNDEWARSVVLAYARRVLQGGWAKQEHRLKDSPKHMLEYADTVSKGRLPDALHNEMAKYRILYIENEFVDRYFERYGT
jgi:hypothetical protein